MSSDVQASLEFGVDRNFVQIDEGRIHYRNAGRAMAGSLPLILAHGGPGSSAGLAPLILQLAPNRSVVAPDMLGHGDSDAPKRSTTTIEFYAQCLIDFLDRLGLDTVDLYGHHTGAQVASVVAINQPERVRRIVLDGTALFPSKLRQQFQQRYAPPIVPQADGGHLAWVWEFAQNLTQYFPHYCRDDAHRLAEPLSVAPEILTAIVSEIMKNWETFHLIYHAAFAHNMRACLPELSMPTLVMKTRGDPLANYAEIATKLIPNALLLELSRADKATAIDHFLRADGDEF